MKMEERIARVEGTLEQMDKRLNHVETEISELRSDLKTNFRWMVGLIVATWALIISMWVTIIMAIG
ncbi:MAG: hypothetical protein QMD22_11380 [archaeon]|nr:hypothetical protein [archaeon]